MPRSLPMGLRSLSFYPFILKRIFTHRHWTLALVYQIDKFFLQACPGAYLWASFKSFIVLFLILARIFNHRPQRWTFGRSNWQYFFFKRTQGPTFGRYILYPFILARIFFRAMNPQTRPASDTEEKLVLFFRLFWANYEPHGMCFFKYFCLVSSFNSR